MANSEAGTNCHADGDYDVFLNFRGQDTRHNFTDFLYDRLIDVGVHVFRDEEKLCVGEVISDNLLHAINNCKLYIPIFSCTYASSKWCLRELTLMVHNVSNSGGQKSIFPIFFDVEPEDVKLKTPLYKADFERHKTEFPDEAEAWRTALEEVDKFKGWKVKKDQSQAAVVKLVVDEAFEKLKIKQKLVTEHLIGLDDRVEALIELLDVKHDVVRLVGIYGMGGIGKTTIAKVIFNKLSSHFGNYCSFLEGIRERSIKEGIVQLQKKLLSDIVGSRSIKKVDDSEEGMRRIGEILRNKKVLLVLDDVNEKDHIKKLIGNSKLDSKSRIIITTRDIAVLQVEGFKGETRQYEMLMMDANPALQLFGQHAFSGGFPSNDYRLLSSDIVSSTGRLPLAIEVIGSLLNGKDREIWEEMLEKLTKVPEKKILEKLRISYDDLDEHHKQIFLDIACFFVNEDKTDAIYMWTDCQFYPKGGLKVLTERCLIKILDNDKFWMHDQLIALGRQIVHEDSLGHVGKQSRLWIEEEALQIIRTQQRKDEVQALEVDGLDGSIEITNEDFERLPNLRFLKLRYGTYVGDFAKCHSNLRWFSWDCPWFFKADKLSLDRLVVCKLGWIYFKDDSKAWDLIKRAHNLKVLSFTWCKGITKIPDISKCSGLEKLTLQCSSLERIESFIGNLQSLIELKIEGCRDFTDLPEEIGALVKLKHFSLGGCGSLRELPSSIGNLTSLIELDLSDTGIRELPNSIGKLKSLCILRFPVVSSIGSRQLPSSISTLVNLEELDLSWHYEMKGEIPIGIGELSSLRILNLEKTRICGIPKTINKLHHLQTLNLSYCHEIQELPELPTSLTHLHLESRSLLSVPNLSNLTNLVELLLSDRSYSTGESNLINGCNLRWIGRLSKLKMLDLHLLNVPAPPELASLSHLEELTLSSLDLKTMVQLPSSLLKLNLEYFRIRRAELLPSLRLRNLSTLGFYYGELEDIPLNELPLLEILKVWSCKWLQRLSIPFELTKLRDVILINCPELVEIQFMGISKSLELLSVDDCISLTRISTLSFLKNLEKLRIKDCYILTNVEGLDELDSLKSLEVKRCPSFRSLIDASCTKIQDDCIVNIMCCGDAIKDSRWEMSLKHYREEIILNTSNKIKHPFTIKFILGVKKNSEDGFAGGIKRKKENVNPGSVTYEGLIADVKGFSFHLERIWYKAPREDCWLHIEIKSDEQVNGMVLKACKRGFIRLYVEGGFESEPSNAECSKATANRRQMRDMIGEPANQNDILRSSCQRGEGVEHYERSCKATTQVEDQRALSSEGAEFDISGFEKEYPACVGESETDGTSSIDDFQSKPGNTEYSEVMGNRRQMRDGRIGRYDSVDGGETASIKNRKDKNETGETANPSEVATSSRLTCEGVEHPARSCKIITEVEDQKDLSSRDDSEDNEDHYKDDEDGDGEHNEDGYEGDEDGDGKDDYEDDDVQEVQQLFRWPQLVYSVDDYIVDEEGNGNDYDDNEDEGENDHEEAKEEDWAFFDISSFGKVSYSTRVGESETDGTSSIDDFQSKPGNIEYLEATGNRRQMRDGRIGRYDTVDGGENEIVEPANPSDLVRSSCQTCEGVEHYGRSCKVTTEVEHQRDLSSISFTIRFHLGVKKSNEGFGFIAGIKRENEDVTPDSVTYEGLITDVNNFGFHLKRIWYKTPGVFRDLFIEIESDEQVQGMVQLAFERGLIQLYIEGGVDIEWEGQYDDEMMEMLMEEWRIKTDDCSDENAAKWDAFRLDEDPDFTIVGGNETHGTSSVDDFQPGNAECFKATRTIAEKELDGFKKHMELLGEPRDGESVGNVTVSTISSTPLTADGFCEAKTVSEASRWSAEVDELERLLNADA